MTVGVSVMGMAVSVSMIMIVVVVMVVVMMMTAIEKAIKSPALKDRIEKMGYIVDYKSPPELKKLSMEDYETANGIAVKIGLHK